MRYWAHINNELQGPFDAEKVTALPGFDPATLICPETAADGKERAWKAASSYPELSGKPPAPPPAAPQARPKPAESPLALTMRGSLIELSAADAAEPPAPAPAPPLPKPPAPPPAAPGDPLAAIAENQTRLLERVERIEKSLLDLRSLLFPSQPR